ncbi:MAG: fibronectin type III domain-containing protein, partial [bacterium]|nr:fibronectin type III domain-containing protein [bacterium]
WYDRGIATGSYAEITRIASAGIPGIMMELAFHDDTTSSQLDNYQLRNPKFNNLLCRAIYKGVCRFFYTNPTILPLPPVNVRVVNVGDGTLRLTWSPQPDPLESTAVATAYRVYRSLNGKGFDNGTVTSATTVVVSGLSADSVYYFQVAAFNAGGESFPSETLAARVKSSGKASILMVNGYDRIDTSVGIDRSDPINTKVNQTFDYIIQHAQAIANATDTVSGGKFYFDSAANEVIRLNLVQLTTYRIVDWLSGQQATADSTFTFAEQTAVQNFLNNQGRLFVSGAELGWDLIANGNSVDSSFYRNYLKADYVNDDANVYSVNGSAGGIFAGLSGITFDNGSQGVYNVAYPDSINSFGGSTVTLTYAGTAYNAAVEHKGTYKLVHFAFPFESIYPASNRNTV